MCWFMKRNLVLLVICGLMLMYATQVQAAEEQLGEDLVVDYSPDTLELRPGDMEEIIIVVTNTGDEAYHVGLEYILMECPGGSRGIFSEDYFQLLPGESKDIVCQVTSNAISDQDPGDSDANIEVNWGPALSPSQEGDFPYTEIAHQNRFSVEVEDEFGMQSGLWLGLLMASVAAAVILVVLIMRRM